MINDKRLFQERYDQLSEKTGTLKVHSPDEKRRLINTANSRTNLQEVLSI